MTIYTCIRPLGSRAKLASSKFVLAAIASGFVGAMCLGTASATTAYDDVPTLVIRYSDTDLATDSGAHVLYRRIVSAAEKACPPVLSGTWTVSPAIRQCREQMVDLTIRKINNPVLAAVRASEWKNG